MDQVSKYVECQPDWFCRFNSFGSVRSAQFELLSSIGTTESVSSITCIRYAVHGGIELQLVACRLLGCHQRSKCDSLSAVAVQFTDSGGFAQSRSVD